jgi:hypothetical protein
VNPAYISAQARAAPSLYARNNGFAVASLWCGIFGISALAVIFGFIGRSQIRRSRGSEKGTGMATAGIVLGFIWIALMIVIYIAIFAAASHFNNGY